MTHLSMGSAAVVLYAYEPCEVDEIQLIEGELVYVLRKQEDGWWLVQKGDIVGMVPCNHVSIEQPTALIAGWDSCIDPESGDTYYFNEITGKGRIQFLIHQID